MASRNARSEDTVLYSLKDKQEAPHETIVTSFILESHQQVICVNDDTDKKKSFVIHIWIRFEQKGIFKITEL